MTRYASGEDPQVNDSVRCVNSHGTNLLYDGRYQVLDVHSGNVTVKCLGDRINLHASRFDLVSRAPSPEPEQPAVNYEQLPEPLVKWPEEHKLRFGDLKNSELFVWAKAPNMPCLKDIGRWHSIANHDDGVCFGCDDEVRRIQFNPETKVPLFTVI